MKRILLAAAAVAALVLGAVVQAAPSPSTTAHATKQGGEVTIESWLLANPSATGLSATVKACFKLSGAFDDSGGGPTWSDATYSAATGDLGAKCGDWTPVGGAVFVPPSTAGGNLWTLYAVHTISGHRGQIFITFSGTYALATTGHGDGTWVVTGGTGAYTGLKGEGTWTAELGGIFPYIRHTEHGRMWRTAGP